MRITHDSPVSYIFVEKIVRFQCLANATNLNTIMTILANQVFFTFYEVSKYDKESVSLKLMYGLQLLVSSSRLYISPNGPTYC
jgi:hypothetical protein